MILFLYENKYELSNILFYARSKIRRTRRRGQFRGLPSSRARELRLDHTIPFNTTILNHDTSLSVFTCPVDGIYAFMTAVIANIHQNTVTEIVL